MSRNELREELKRKIKVFNGKKEESEMIVSLIRSSSQWQNAETILAFSPLPSEVDITPLLSDKRVLLPYIENNKMEFARAEDMKLSSMGFLEPKHIKSEYGSALMLVPMLGFNGLYRLGRGGGYYDKYIHENRSRLITWGIAFSISECPEFKPEGWDEELDRIISIADGNPASQA
ncbi:MAG: 5-formyltetrahydrofolate cyclo-ligase [Spirochaetes bacterium]|uniref:5-formyltetrahydrofolate cyclo-ligase n=1 Tax=Candidatus Ornithospirochaeta stercoripullorum TaxID=2840899 RepID=A0A9D9H505_9SPIO|nr:5-formyltetrahydrofolate cyclo-ligase [Candidatus Ornithospirochaeta stercoripullorum]